MFSIKIKHFKVKYEGLHLFCHACGRYGHYVESYVNLDYVLREPRVVNDKVKKHEEIRKEATNS